VKGDFKGTPTVSARGSPNLGDSKEARIELKHLHRPSCCEKSW